MNRRCGLSLLEIFIAVTLLVLAIVPLYRHLTTESARNLETEKIQMADRILQSLKEELVALPFSEFYRRIEGAPDPDGPFDIEGYYPVTLVAVLETQKKFKDFKIEGVWSFLMRNDGKRDKTMIQVDAKCTWTTVGKIMERTKSFLLVAPK